MAAPHHPADSAHAHDDSHPVRLAILIVAGTVAVIIGIVLLANFAIRSYGARSLKDDPSMKPEAVARRIAPVAQVAVDPKAPAAPAAAPAKAASPAASAPAPAAAAPAPAAPAKTAAAGGAGKSTYDSACAVCHAAGVANAPKLGDAAAWTPRVKQGKEALYASALKGKGAMPPKGGNASLADDAVKAAVDYMVGSAK